MYGGLYGDMNNYMCGGRHESYMEGLSDNIESTDIIRFSYTGNGNLLTAEKKDNKTYIYATGGGKYNKRDGSYFIVKYDSDDMSIFNLLLDIINKYNINRDNGHCVYVDGLPSGIGDLIDIDYSNGEKIYKSNNQCPTISSDASKEIYDVFHEFTKKHGLDFTSSGSNVQLFDDADEEYLQGTWKGKHFGREVEVTFKDKKLTIKVDGNITDEDIEYIIKDGFVRKNKLEEGKTGEKHTDYVDFEGVSSFAKKNWFTIVGYFTKESNSTCDLMNFDKEKPKDE